MSSATSSGSADSKRTARARDEFMTYYVVGANQHVMEGDSGNRHVLDVDGSTATSCSCPDHDKAHNTCKHMIAYNNWFVDKVVMSSGIEVDLD